MTRSKIYIDPVKKKCNEVCTAIQVLAEDKRRLAEFHALEALEATNQDATEQRDKALRLAAEAKGCQEALEIVRSVMVPA